MDADANPTDAQTGPEGTDVLIADHRRVDQLFMTVGLGEGSTLNHDVVREIVRELSIHAAIEEEVLYPTVRERLGAADGEEQVTEGLEEHQTIKELLVEIEHKRDDETLLRGLLEELGATVRHHVREEEEEMFPALRAVMSQDERRVMGQELEQLKSIAPTHPHPHAPNTPPANIIVGAGAALVDRARDALTNRGDRS